jgi:hypothetical protein
MDIPKKGGGRNNKLAGQIGEFLVCAELGRRGFIATPFAGNVPAFDILVADEACNTVPVQVKASRGDGWPTVATKWMKIDQSQESESRAQNYLGPAEIKNPNMIYVHVAISELDGSRDQFFILTEAQLQEVVIQHYKAYMDPKGWLRPKNPSSFRVQYHIEDLQPYRDNWTLITEKLQPL